MGSWFDRMVDAVERVYQRRLNHASGLDAHSIHAEIAASDLEAEEEEVEIVNLPRGVPVAAPVEREPVNE